MVSAYSDGTVRIWDAAAEPVLVDHEGSVYQVAWHLDGKRLASATEDGTVRI